MCSSLPPRVSHLCDLPTFFLDVYARFKPMVPRFANDSIFKQKLNGSRIIENGFHSKAIRHLAVVVFNLKNYSIKIFFKMLK